MKETEGVVEGVWKGVFDRVLVTLKEIEGEGVTVRVLD